MNELALASAAPKASDASAALAPSSLDTQRFPAQARWVLKLLERAEHGALVVTFPDGQRACFGRGRPTADVRLAEWGVFGAALARGDIGFAESFADGAWSSHDPARVLQFFIRNRAAVERVVYGSFLGSLACRLRHLLNRNSRAQAKKNITAHYDLGNDFYALWLDPTMTYSSALLAGSVDPNAPLPAAVLEAGQHAKYARVLDELRLPEGARVLEIGCGWGGLAEAAAARGLQLTGLTLSPSQLAFAQQRLARAGMRGGMRANLKLQDYRDEHGRYDGIASIEMFEAVGEAYWPSYFATLARCLAPGARACVQTITIDDALFERYRRGTDFIQQYVFPGGMLPSPSAFRAQAQRAGLRVVEEFAFGHHYAATLATWRQQFNAQLPAVRALGFDERFIRLWNFYLAYCEAAFAERNTDVVQYTLVRQ